MWVSVPTDKSDPAQVAAADKTLNEYWDTGLYSTGQLHRACQLGLEQLPGGLHGEAVASELVAGNVYDYRDRLVAVRSYSSGAPGDRTEYRYDPLSRPVRKTSTEAGVTTTTEMVYLGVSDAVVRETETGASTKTRSYAFDVLGDRVGLSETISGGGSRWSYVYDPLGSVELLLDQANTVMAAYGYTAYGDTNTTLTKSAAGFTPNTNLYRYTGKRWDPAARDYDMGARTYMPAVGRWFQQDAYADALDNLALSTDPLTQNRYAFTAANPVNYIEIDGHMPARDQGPEVHDWMDAAQALQEGKKLAGRSTSIQPGSLCEQLNTNQSVVLNGQCFPCSGVCTERRYRKRLLSTAVRASREPLSVPSWHPRQGPSVSSRAPPVAALSVSSRRGSSRRAVTGRPLELQLNMWATLAILRELPSSRFGRYLVKKRLVGLSMLRTLAPARSSLWRR